MVRGRIKLYLCTGWIGSSIVFLGSAGCTTGKADIHEETVLDTQVGYATFYSKHFQGDRTASGLRFDNHKAVAAHPSYPFGTVARVTNLENAKSVNVAIVDRGPYGKNRREGAIIDLSRSAAERLDMMHDGQVRVKIEVLLWGDGDLRDKVQSGAGNERH